MKYVEHNQYGQITAIITAPFDVALAEGQLEAPHSHEVHATTHYVQDGALAPFPIKPAPHHTWDWPTKSWLPDLDDAREATRQAWNQWRDQELVKGFAHNEHVYHSDDRFIGELQLILKGYERGHLTGTSPIRTVDNGTVHMTHVEVEALLLLLGLHRQAIYQQSWVGKDALASKSTLEEIVAAGPPV